MASMIAKPRLAYLITGCIVITFFLIASTQHDRVLGIYNNLKSSSHDADPAQSVSESHPWAYATFLSTRIDDENERDPYFTATRVLAYQLLHQKSTRSRLNIPFIVMVPPHVSQAKHEALTREGAKVVQVEYLEPSTPWLHPGETRFIDQFTKLRLFELTQYERILYMDSDMLLTRNLDGIWNETAVREVQKTKAKGKKPSQAITVNGSTVELPQDYVVVGVSDTRGPQHDFPPPESDEMNGGFILLRPDKALFQYYAAILDVPDLFDSGLMEQALLNFAHKRDGRMPWRAFEPGRWNVNWPNEKDVKGGCASLHDKFWEQGNKDWIARSLVERWWRVQGRAEGFWQKNRGADV